MVGGKGRGEGRAPLRRAKHEKARHGRSTPHAHAIREAALAMLICDMCSPPRVGGSSAAGGCGSDPSAMPHRVASRQPTRWREAMGLERGRGMHIL